MSSENSEKECLSYRRQIWDPLKGFVVGNCEVDMDHIEKQVKETQEYVANRAMNMESRVYALEAENAQLRELLQDYIAVINTQTTLLAVARQHISLVYDNLNNKNDKVHAFFREDKKAK